MIEIDIVSSPDKDIIGKRTYFFNDVLVGKSNKCHFPISDPDVAIRAVKFSVKQDGLICSSQENNFFFLKGKKLKGTKLCQVGDEITIGNTILKILNFSITKEDLPLDRKQLYIDQTIKDPKLEQLFKLLEKELIYLEGQDNLPE